MENSLSKLGSEIIIECLDLIRNNKARFIEQNNSLASYAKKIKKIDVPVAIVAGGQGTRLSPLTKIIPKPLIPVGEVTMIEKIMENFQKLLQTVCMPLI